MGVIRRLQTKAALTKQSQARDLAQQLELYPEEELPAVARAQLLNRLVQTAHPADVEGIWQGGYSMISREQTVLVWEALYKHPGIDRRNAVMMTFNYCLANTNWNNNEIMLTRDDLAEKVGCSPADLSKNMTVLESLGVIRRIRRKIPGVKGPGMAVYILNEHVGWNGNLEVRKERARKVEQPKLALVGA